MKSIIGKMMRETMILSEGLSIVLTVFAYLACLSGCHSNNVTCKPGYKDYGDGECRSINPCAVFSGCLEDHRSCTNYLGVAQCGDCIGGYHLEANSCVEDVQCEENTCNGHGDCDDTQGALVCDCRDKYTGEHCEECEKGFADYGDGECKPSDPCADETLCLSQNRKCLNNQGVTQCGDCLGGYHIESDSCVEDIKCEENTCNGHGSCNDTTGVPVCSCEDKYTGNHCEDCEAGFIDYGDGECRPSNPCANDTQCASENRKCVNSQGVAVCGDCVAGYVENGEGDCMPEPLCTNQLCSGHGVCVETIEYAMCHCDTGYSGIECDSCTVGWIWNEDSQACENPCSTQLEQLAPITQELAQKPTLPPVVVDTPYSTVLPEYEAGKDINQVTGLPAGLVYTPATGTIEGTPQEVGDFLVAVESQQGEDAQTTTYWLPLLPKLCQMQRRMLIAQALQPNEQDGDVYFWDTVNRFVEPPVFFLDESANKDWSSTYGTRWIREQIAIGVSIFTGGMFEAEFVDGEPPQDRPRVRVIPGGAQGSFDIRYLDQEGYIRLPRECFIDDPEEHGSYYDTIWHEMGHVFNGQHTWLPGRGFAQQRAKDVFRNPLTLKGYFGLDLPSLDEPMSNYFGADERVIYRIYYRLPIKWGLEELVKAGLVEEQDVYPDPIVFGAQTYGPWPPYNYLGITVFPINGLVPGKIVRLIGGHMRFYWQNFDDDWMEAEKFNWNRPELFFPGLGVPVASQLTAIEDGMNAGYGCLSLEFLIPQGATSGNVVLQARDPITGKVKGANPVEFRISSDSSACAPTCDDDNTCTIDRVVEKQDGCNVICENEPITLCQSGDRCCPTGCNQEEDRDCAVELDTSEQIVSTNSGYKLSFDGNTLVAGNPFEGENGMVRIYSYQEGSWILESALTYSDEKDVDLFGLAVDVSGSYAVVGTKETRLETGGWWIRKPAAHVFKRIEPGSWIEDGILIPEHSFGDNVSYSRYASTVGIDGDWIMVGAYRLNAFGEADDVWDAGGIVYIFQRVDGSWQERERLLPHDQDDGDLFGHALDLRDGVAVIGAYQKGDYIDPWPAGYIDPGAAYVFRLLDGQWLEETRLQASDLRHGDRFGYAVSTDGTRVAVGAMGSDGGLANELIDSGAVYIFEYINGQWKESAKITASDAQWGDLFGYSVAIDGNRLLVGAVDEDGQGVERKERAGAVYLFELDEFGEWVEKSKIVAKDAEAKDEFGYSVSLGGNKAIIGAPGRGDDSHSDERHGAIFEINLD